MILNPKRQQGLVVNPAINTTKDLIKVAGPGVFVSGYVTKQGGTNDITQVAMYIDGVNVVALTFAAADNIGIDQVNNSGLQLAKDAVKCISIGFNEPLYYATEFRIEIKTGSDSGVVQIVANAVLGKGCQYPG